jgi:hypothetical protein
MQDIKKNPIIMEPKPEINYHQIIDNHYILSVHSSLFTPIYILYDRAQ